MTLGTRADDWGGPDDGPDDGVDTASLLRDKMQPDGCHDEPIPATCRWQPHGCHGVTRCPNWNPVGSTVRDRRCSDRASVAGHLDRRRAGSVARRRGRTRSSSRTTGAGALARPVDQPRPRRARGTAASVRVPLATHRRRGAAGPACRGADPVEILLTRIGDHATRVDIEESSAPMPLGPVALAASGKGAA